MKQLKQFEYSIDNGFVKGVFFAYNARQGRRFLRQLLGWKLYLQVRKDIIINEVEQ